MTVTFQNGSFLTGSAGASSYTQSGGVTAATLYNTDYLDKKYDYTEERESYEVAISGRDAAMESKITNICSYIESGREDKVIAAYNQLLSEMQMQTRYAQLVGEDGDDTQLRAVARQLIEMQTGMDLEEYITENTANYMERGFEINWDGDTTTEADLLKELCDIDRTTNLDGAKKTLGTVGKFALSGTAAVAGIAIGATFGLPAAIIGGVIGLGATLIRK